jgi:hypothetical protein
MRKIGPVNIAQKTCTPTVLIVAEENREPGSNMATVPINMQFCINTPAATTNGKRKLSPTCKKVIIHLTPTNSQT